MKINDYLGPSGAKVSLYHPEKAGNAVILICPGGGYQFLSPREAEPVADAFLAAGYYAAVLRYSVYDGAPLKTLPLTQAAWAVSLLRGTLGLPVYVCGFSAGAHLCASLSVHADTFKEQYPNCRPDGSILCYPVISAGEFAHKDSIYRLTHGDPQLMDFFSLENHADHLTPPAFLWHTADDETVPVQNTLLYSWALAAHQIPYEAHIFPHGVHGLSLATPEVDEPAKGRIADPYVARWMELCLCWLDQRQGIRQ